MTQRIVRVRVLRRDVGPVVGARVHCCVYPVAAGGCAREGITDLNGVAEFALDADEYAEVSVSVEGAEKALRGPLQRSCRVPL